MPSYVVKAPPPPHGATLLDIDEKSMWRGRDIGPGDDVFLFAAEHHGGRGLYARGAAVTATRGPGSRVALQVECTAMALRPLGRGELRAFRGQPKSDPGAELDHKLYVQATNKVAGVSEAAAAFLRGFF